MVTDRLLTGWQFLITRPANRGAALAGLLAAQGAQVVVRPSLVIREGVNSDAIVAAMERADLAVFVSVYAARALQRAAETATLSLKPHLQIAAVGQATADALSHQGFDVQFKPTAATGSEGLIDLLGTRNWCGQDAMIFAAQSGRPLLADWLAENGASVSRVVAYTRHPNSDHPDGAFSAFLDACHRTIILTSLESAEALVGAVAQSLRAALLASNVIVISNRLAEGCRCMGFTGELGVAHDATDQAVLQVAMQQALTRRKLATDT